MSKGDDASKKARMELRDFDSAFVGVRDQLQEKLRAMGTDGLLRVMACCRVVMADGDDKDPSYYHAAVLMINQAAKFEVEERIAKEQRQILKVEE